VTEQPTISGIYEYLTGGSEYTEADKGGGEHLRSLLPSISKWLTMLRNLLPAIATELKQAGVTHVIDFASGIPINHIHNTLQDAKVVYSDINEHVVAEGQKIVNDNPNVLYVQHDINDPVGLIKSPEVQALFGEVGKLAVGLSGVSAFLEPEDLQAINQQIYDNVPAGTLLYSQFESKSPDKMTPKFQQFLDLMIAQSGSYNMYSIEEIKSSVEPWTMRQMTPIAEYLNMPADYLKPEDYEEVDIQFHVVIAEKV